MTCERGVSLNGKIIILTAFLVFTGQLILNSAVSLNAQAGPSNQGYSDALWHLPKFAESGWFIHAHNGKVRACNMDGVSVVGSKQGPRCSTWE